MDNITLTKKEYNELLEAKRKLDLVLKSPRLKKKNLFRDTAFGILKGSFGKESSVNYVATIRKLWRV